MNFLFEAFPVLVFFLVFLWKKSIYLATAALMIAAVLHIGIYWFRHKRVEKITVISLISVLVLGGLTVTFHNPLFIKWKPSIVYWVVSAFLLTRAWMGKPPIFYHLTKKTISLPVMLCARLDFMWSYFFLVLGIVNLLFVYLFSTKVWVYFKLFGALGMMLLLMIIQAIYIAYYMKTHKIDLTKNHTHEQ